MMAPTVAAVIFLLGSTARARAELGLARGCSSSPQAPLPSLHAALPPISVITASALASLLPSLPQLAEEGKGLVPAVHLYSPSHPLRCGAPGEPGRAQAGTCLRHRHVPCVPACVVTPLPEWATRECPSLRWRVHTRYLRAYMELLHGLGREQECRVLGAGCRVQGAGCWVQGGRLPAAPGAVPWQLLSFVAASG